jgi:hypothetical protein
VRPSRNCGWGEASSSDELAGDFGNSPEGISTGNRRVFRLSAGNWLQISLGLFRQHRPIADVVGFKGSAINLRIDSVTPFDAGRLPTFN